MMFKIACGAISVGFWGISQSDFWGMTPKEWWILYDANYGDKKKLSENKTEKLLKILKKRRAQNDTLPVRR